MTIIDSQVHAMRRTRQSDPGQCAELARSRHGRRDGGGDGQKSASTARSSSPPFPCTDTTPATRWKCSRPIPAGSPSSSRSTRTIRRSPMSSLTGKRHRARSASASCCRKRRGREANDPGLDRILRAAVRHDFPVNILCWDNLDVGTALIDRHPETTVHHRPSGHPAASRAARIAAALGRPAEGAGTRQASERGDQGQRRLHAVPAAVSVPGHLGPARPRFQRLGFRSLPMGHGLDARLRCRQPTNRPSNPFFAPIA